MSALREVQAALRRALLDDDIGPAAAFLRDDGLGAAARLAIYRHHVRASLTAVLMSTYPVVVRLVDPRFFRYAADRYIRSEPPTGPCLFEYGAGFADFLARFPPTRPLAYLPDVARFEWAMNVAQHARDDAPADAATLDPGLRVTLHPAVTLLRSTWPVDRIWRANQPGADEGAIDLDGDGTRLQVWRVNGEVVFRRLSVAERAFRVALAVPQRLEAAAAAALTADPEADVTTLVRAALDEEILIVAAM